jgi:hypothetical protein
MSDTSIDMAQKPKPGALYLRIGPELFGLDEQGRVWRDGPGWHANTPLRDIMKKAFAELEQQQ